MSPVGFLPVHIQGFYKSSIFMKTWIYFFWFFLSMLSILGSIRFRSRALSILASMDVSVIPREFLANPRPPLEIEPHRNKGLSSTFQPPEEGRSVQPPKHCDKYGDKDEDNSPVNINNIPFQNLKKKRINVIQ